MDESITKELRLWASDRGFTSRHEIFRVADRIDAWFDREPTAKREEVDGLKADNADLQARLDASIPAPLDADGVPWTRDDVDKSFSLTDGDKATSGLVREIAYGCPREGWWIVDQYDTHYPASKCHHGTPEPSEPNDSQERIDADVEKGECEYFGRTIGGGCYGCPVENDENCATIKCLDLLRRQRELDGAGETR